MTNPYYTNPFRAFMGLTLAWKIIAVVLLLALIGFATGVGGGAIEKYRERKFDRKIAEKQAEVDSLTKQRDSLIEQARVAEAKAEVKEQEADALRSKLSEYGRGAAQAEQKIQEAFDQYEQDKAVTGADVPDDVRRERLCRKRAELGYPCR